MQCRWNQGAASEIEEGSFHFGWKPSPWKEFELLQLTCSTLSYFQTFSTALLCFDFLIEGTNQWLNLKIAIVLLFYLNTLYLIIYASLDLGLNKLIRLILVQAGSLKDSKMQWINPAMKSSQNPLLLNPLVKNQVSIKKGDQKQSKVCT